MSISLDGEHVSIGILRDITERKAMEELRKRSLENERLLDEARHYDKIKTEFFANMSHEIRTPLNVLLSSQQLVSTYINNGMPCCSHQQRINKHLEIMKQNCNRLVRLFNNIIDITKIDSGFVELNLRNYNVVNIIEETVLSVAEYIENKGISLIFDTEIEDVTMAVDGEKLERIILNLLSNATKFTNPGGALNVYVKSENNYIIISVKDTGIGIPEEKQDLIFNRFVQVDKSFTRNNEGSGIGLSIVKSLVELHGGLVEVKSSPGLGSEFIVRLPIRPIDCAEVSADMDVIYKSEGAHIEFSDIYND